MRGEKEKALEERQNSESWKPKVLLAGAVIGALVGTAAAYLVVNASERSGPPKVTASQGVKLGMMLFGMLRGVTELLKSE